MVGSKYGSSLWSMVFFCAFTKGLVERYPELFDNDGSSTQHQVNFSKKWKSYTAIFELAGGEIQKMDEVVELPLEQCLLYLAFKADKSLLESMVHKEAMKSRR